MDHYLSLGKLLKKGREASGLTQAEVAERYSYKSAQFVSNWERGLSYPPYAILKDLCKLYGLDLDMVKKKLKNLLIQHLERDMKEIDKGSLL